MNTRDAITQIYAGLLHLYPAEFQSKFAEEMQTVFGDGVAGALEESGARGLAFFCLRELATLPGNLLREHMRPNQKEPKMTTLPGNRRSFHTALFGSLAFAACFLLLAFCSWLLSDTALNRLGSYQVSLLWLIACALSGGLGGAILGRFLRPSRSLRWFGAAALAFAASVPISDLLQSPGFHFWLINLRSDNMVNSFSAINLLVSGALLGGIAGLLARDWRKMLLWAIVGGFGFILGFTVATLLAMAAIDLAHLAGVAEGIASLDLAWSLISGLLILSLCGAVSGGLLGLVVGETENWPATV